jgi:hypothetical protein
LGFVVTPRARTPRPQPPQTFPCHFKKAERGLGRAA